MIVILFKIRQLLSTILPIKRSPFGYFIIFLQLFYMYQVFVTDDVGGYSFSIQSLCYMGLSIITVYLLFQIISVISSINKRIVVFSNLTLLICYGLITAYEFGANEALNWSVIADNLTIIWSLESLQVIINSLDIDALYYLIGFVLLWVILDLWKGIISKGQYNSHRRKKALCGTLLYLALIIIPTNSYDPIANVIRSAYGHYKSDIKIEITPKENNYPFVNDGTEFNFDTITNKPKKPHIFLIIVESLNASALNKRTPKGLEYTPFLNQLQHNSLFIPNFYGNSIQTAKGHFATLFSAIPSIKGKAYTQFDQLSISSIALILKQHGYNTVYFNAYKNKDFDNTYNFVTERHFDYESVVPYLSEQDIKTKLKWGVEDRIFYERFFTYFDKQSPNKPQFIVLSTIANHFPFNSLPVSKQYLYPKPSHLKKHYANSVRLSDDGLKQFFIELKKRHLLDKSIVIVTGDHAFPMGEHGNYHLEAGYHEESFRIPFFMVWESVIKPQKIKKAYSQMDIIPTIIDLLDLTVGQNTFQGTSIFNPGPQHCIYLIQPYGKHLSIINYPEKFRYYTQTSTEYAYNLIEDPSETTNIIDQISDQQKRLYHNKLNQLYQHQYALKTNTLIPSFSE